ncbi:MAG: hypothetical protein LBM18_00795 [Oscillospiraceae bacterium]|jgi:hypothetical protein|nr:hypothetical protein [Oscillospiraceae bacterium]
MSAGLFGEVWRFAGALTVFSLDGSESREFRGFLEPLSLTQEPEFSRERPFALPRERFRLISEPGEDFYGGSAIKISRGGEIYELLTVKPIYFGETVTHRESVLLRTGEVTADV